MKTRKKTSATVTLTQIDPLLGLVSQIKSLLFSLRDTGMPMPNLSKSWSKKINFQFDRDNILGFLKKRFPLVILLIVLVVIVFQIKNFVINSLQTKATDQRVVISGPVASQSINKSLNISIKDAKGVEATKVKYFLDSAELRNEIIVSGQKMVAVKGRTFLILNIKLTNNYSKEISLRARDNVRIVLPGNNDKIAADIHNDPVAIQPLSTKATRLGFPIDDTKKNVTLELGELEGPKQTVSLKF